MLPPEERPRPPHPCVHFVEDEEGAKPVAQLPRVLKVLIAGDSNTGFDLDGLDDERSHVFL